MRLEHAFSRRDADRILRMHTQITVKFMTKNPLSARAAERELALRWGYTPLEALSGITRTFVGKRDYAQMQEFQYAFMVIKQDSYTDSSTF